VLFNQPLKRLSWRLWGGEARSFLARRPNDLGGLKIYGREIGIFLSITDSVDRLKRS
jgi:hypothetical protein